MRPPHPSKPDGTPPLGVPAVGTSPVVAPLPSSPGLSAPVAPTPRVMPLPATPQIRPATGPHSIQRPQTGPHSVSRPQTGPHSVQRPFGAPAPLPQTPPLAHRPSGSDVTEMALSEGSGGPLRNVQFPRTGGTLRGPRGEYAVNKVIGEGAFGAVYECIGPFDQVYAVKMVRPANRPYQEVHSEWAKEVARLMSLRHPNVVYIYDAFEEGHLFYLALERCDYALQAMLGTPLREGLVIELARQLLAAVQFLHDNDIVHDDLHAGNVLITQATDRPQVKISDFGISHELRGHATVRPNIVHHAIMAPEILSTGYTSKQSDIYQVGLLLYWMVTGSTAIDMTAPYDDLVRVVADGEPRKKAEAIGTPLANVIAKMLRRRENFRYSSAREVWADLRELEAWRQRSLFPLR